MHGRAFFAVVAMAMATVAVSQDLDFFAKHVNPLTEVVQKKWGNATAKWSVVEIDACRYDPMVVVRDSGCLSYDPMDSLNEIGFLNIVWALGTATHDMCGPPNIQARLDVTRGNHTLIYHEDPFVGDICTPIGLNNKTRITVDEALPLAQKKTGGFKFYTINFRYVLYPCVSEPTHIFTVDPSNPANPGAVFVGVDTRNVCKTVVTRMYTMPNGTIPEICQQPDRLPDCYP